MKILKLNVELDLSNPKNKEKMSKLVELLESLEDGEEDYNDTLQTEATFKCSLDTYEGREAFIDFIKARSYLCALEEIANGIFRPARKHGYSQGENLMKLQTGKISEEMDNFCTEAISELETMFYEILEQNDITLF